jgi:hypothetical protein
MRNAFALALAAAILAPAAALAQQPTTTRIETRPFYGATVTLEEGVRVFRPLPPHQRVIINPGGATPLSLGFEEKRSVSHHYHHGSAGPVASSYSAGGYGGVPYYGRKIHRGGDHHRSGIYRHRGGRGHGGGHGGGRH